MSKNIKIKVSGRVHLWGWFDFKDAINADIVDYEVNNNIIKSITFLVSSLPSEELLNEYGFKYEVIS